MFDGIGAGIGPTCGRILPFAMDGPLRLIRGAGGVRNDFSAERKWLRGFGLGGKHTEPVVVLRIKNINSTRKKEVVQVRTREV